MSPAHQFQPMPLEDVDWIRLRLHVCQLVIGMDVENGDQACCNGSLEVVVLHIYVLGTWAHGWGLCKAQGTCIIFEKLAVDYWNSLPNVVPSFLHFLDCLHKRNGFLKSLAEADVL